MGRVGDSFFSFQSTFALLDHLLFLCLCISGCLYLLIPFILMTHYHPPLLCLIRVLGFIFPCKTCNFLFANLFSSYTNNSTGLYCRPYFASSFCTQCCPVKIACVAGAVSSSLLPAAAETVVCTC